MSDNPKLPDYGNDDAMPTFDEARKSHSKEYNDWMDQYVEELKQKLTQTPRS